MRRWKSFIAIGLAATMITPSSIPQTMWAAEFSAESTESVQTGDEFGDGDGEGREDNSSTAFGTGEAENADTGSDQKEEQAPEQSDASEDEAANAGENAEGYTVQLYSQGKLAKSYVVPYANAETAKAPAALSGRTGYTFKEWNTAADGTGESYKPGASIKKLLEAAGSAKEAQAAQTADEEAQEPASGIELNVETADDTSSAMETETVNATDTAMAAQTADVVTETDGVNATDTAMPAEAEGTSETPAETNEEEDIEENTAENAEGATEASANNTVVLYAVWQKAATYKITYKLNNGKNNSANPKTYTSDVTVVLKNPTRSGYHFAGWYTDSKFKNKISKIESGRKGALVLYAKWVKQVSASAKAATLNFVRGAKAQTIKASATVPNYVKSIDDYYYLVYVDSNSGKVKSAAAKVSKPEAANAKITFKLNITGHPEYAQGKFAIAVKKTKKTYTVISGKSYVSSPEKLSSNKAAYYVPKTKKGIQSTNINEITETKSKTAFFNLFASDIMRSGYGTEAYKYNGKTYYFNSLSNFQYFVQQCNAKGVQVTAQISLDRNSDTQSLTTGKSPYAETAYYGWNTSNSAARQKMEAAFAYLGEKFGSNDCYVSNWILGNEINSASHYYYVGNVSFSKYISMYSEAFRCLYNAVRSNRGSSKVFTCLDNCWNQKNIFTVCYTSRSTLDSFASSVSRLQKGVSWNLAYHAYSQPLTEAKFWSSQNAPLLSSDGNSATFITMHNIQALTNYVKSKYGSGTRVILSEQGFSSSYGGQASQAASMALAYYKAACNPMIDAFIIRSYQDESHEVAQGLALGLRDAKGKKKTVYNVFCNMDGSNSLKYTQKVLNSQVGNWKSQVPGYTAKRVAGMYRK